MPTPANWQPPPGMRLSDPLTSVHEGAGARLPTGTVAANTGNSLNVSRHLEQWILCSCERGEGSSLSSDAGVPPRYDVKGKHVYTAVGGMSVPSLFGGIPESHDPDRASLISPPPQLGGGIKRLFPRFYLLNLFCFSPCLWAGNLSEVSGQGAPTSRGRVCPTTVVQAADSARLLRMRLFSAAGDSLICTCLSVSGCVQVGNFIPPTMWLYGNSYTHVMHA